MSDALNFDLELQCVPVTLTEKRGEQRVKLVCELREMTGALRDEYLKRQMEKVTRGPDGKPNGVKDITGMYADLVAASLFHLATHPIDKDGKEGDAVPLETPTRFTIAQVQAWPANVQKTLFAQAQSLSGLDDKAEDVAGKP